MKYPRFKVIPRDDTKEESQKARFVAGLLDYEWKKNFDALFGIYIDPSTDHIVCKWYCKFLFWKKHPKWIVKANIISYKDLR